jgi:hypothetical protein
MYRFVGWILTKHKGHERNLVIEDLYTFEKLVEELVES